MIDHQSLTYDCKKKNPFIFLQTKISLHKSQYNKEKKFKFESKPLETTKLHSTAEPRKIRDPFLTFLSTRIKQTNKQTKKGEIHIKPGDL